MTDQTPLPPTDKHARDMTPAEQEAFFAQCKKLEGASYRPASTAMSAKDMTPAQREEWWANHARQWR